MTPKQALRRALRERRSALSPRAGSAEALEAGRAATAWLQAEPDFAAVRVIALYAAIGHEFDPAPLGRLAGERGVRLCYPRVLSHRPPRLTFHLWCPDAALVPGPLGIPEPHADQPLAKEIDAFVVPGLGFDRSGRRLGYGCGHYDAALRARPAALRIALCYPWQIVEAIPHEEQDEPMDLIVTPLGVHRTFARTLSQPKEER